MQRTGADIPGRQPPVSEGRKAETQARIVAAAAELFVTRGYEATPISAIAVRARVSRATIFWHFGDKATLFQEVFQRMLLPFIEELRGSLQHLDARKRLFELFDVYERFVASHQDTIGNFVRWAMESPTLRASLQKPLFTLHDEFTRDIRESCEELLGGPTEAAELAAALIALLDGKLMLEFLESNPQNRELRRAGLRRIAERILPAPR